MTTIRARLMVMLLTGLVAVLIAGGTAVYLIEQATLLGQFDAALETRAHTVASLIKQEPVGTIFELQDAPTSIMAAMYFEVMIPSGVVVKRSENLGPNPKPLRISRKGKAGDVKKDEEEHRRSMMPLKTLEEGQFVFEDVELPGPIHGRAVWFAFRPRLDEDDWEEADREPVPPPLLIVVAALDREPIDRALATLLNTLITVGAAVGLTMGVLVFLGVKWGLKPLARLGNQLGDVDGETIGERIDEAGAPGELIPIYRELNGMLKRVEQTIERERSFADAAAHELRTPLAELRAGAEVALRWPDVEKAKATLRETLAIGREMESLVESLLLISRGQGSQGIIEREEVPLASILHECLERADDAINRKSLQIAIIIGQDDTLRGTPDAIGIIVRNLIDNAVRYTPRHGSITVRDGHVVNGSHALVVENGPVTLDETELSRLFEPFWQAQRSRTDRTHVGLGLAVVHQIAQAVGLAVEAKLEGDRLQIRLLPM